MQVNQETLEQAYQDGEMEINGRVYKMLKIPHKQALKVLGFGQQFEAGQMTIGSQEWNQMERLLCTYFTCDDVILSKDEKYFERFPGDYMTFISYALGMISRPYMPGSATS